MNGTITFKCEGSSVDVSTKLEHVDMFDKAHLVMLMFECIDLDVSKDMDEIAELLAIASLLKRLNLTEGSKVDMSAMMTTIANHQQPEEETETEEE